MDHENTGGVPGLESVGSKEVCPGPVETGERPESLTQLWSDGRHRSSAQSKTQEDFWIEGSNLYDFSIYNYFDKLMKFG